MTGVTYQTTIPLPYVCGKMSVNSDDVYDDSVDVEVQQVTAGSPYCSLVLSPGGPCTFHLLGFGVDELRQLARFLDETADKLACCQ